MIVLAEHASDRIASQLGEEVAVSSPLLLRGMSCEFVNDPLVHPLAGERRNKRVPQNVKAL